MSANLHAGHFYIRMSWQQQQPLVATYFEIVNQYKSRFGNNFFFTCIEKNNGFHAEKLLTRHLEICELLGNDLHGQTQVINWCPPHLIPEAQKGN